MKLLDTEPEPAFDDLNRLAAGICETPIVSGTNHAAAARPALRCNGDLARFGGEEFVVMLPNTPGELARQIAELIEAADSAA